MRAKNNSEEKIGINFFEIINILNKNKVKYWICHYTLLDITRDKTTKFMGYQQVSIP